MGKQQRITAAEAVRMLEVYMSPTRLLENRQDSDAEIVARVESMLDEGRPVPAELRAVAVVVKKKKKEIETSRALLKDYLNQWERGGHVDLHRYSRRESGVHLFRAYLKQRDSVRPTLQARRAHIELALKSWHPRDGYTAEIADLSMLDILDGLDPIIADLLRVCESSSSADPAKALKNLRHALRIGRGRSRYDAELETTQRTAIYLWWQAANKKDSRSLSAIASDIAHELSISKRAALNYLEQGQREHAGLKVAFAYAQKSTPPLTAKANQRSTGGRKRKPLERQRLTFGKQKRANQ